MIDNELNEIEEKGFLDKIQDKFYAKLAGFDDCIIVLSLTTVASMIFAVIVGSLFNNYFLYLGVPFSISATVTVVLAMVYFFAFIFFEKRRIEQCLEKPKDFKTKCLKFFYDTVKFVIGFGFVWNLFGDFTLSLIWGRPVQLVGEGYSPVAVKLFVCASLLAVSYFAIVMVNFSAPMIGFGDTLSKQESVFNLSSKRSFATLLGGACVCVTLLIAAVTIDSKILLVLNETAAKLAQIQKTYREY